MHKRSAGFRSCSDHAPDTRETARRHLLYFLTKDKNEKPKYPWEYKFEHDSYPDRIWGPYKTFPDFLANRNPKGPGPAWSSMTVDDIRDWFHKDAEIIDLLDEAMRRGPGKKWDSRTADENTFDNIQGNPAPTGTSKEATLRRLRKDRPDLLQRVTDGEMSANAAAVEAGFRPVTVQISAKTKPEDAVSRIKKKLGEEYLQAMIEAMEEPPMT